MGIEITCLCDFVTAYTANRIGNNYIIFFLMEGEIIMQPLKHVHALFRRIYYAIFQTSETEDFIKVENSLKGVLYRQKNFNANVS